MRVRIVISLILLVAFVPTLTNAQAVPSRSAVVPQLVNFSGVLTDINRRPLSGVVGVTFLLYKDEQGGSPLWLETQNVQLDQTGHYKVMLGSANGSGLPSDIFVAGEARWLGVQAQGQPEQARIMLLSVPYALKAGDAATVGGLPPSAFVLAGPASGASASTATAASSSTPPPAGAVTGSGTLNFLPLWNSASNIISSVIFQSGTGSTAKIGINTITPTSALDVKGGSTVRGTLSLPSNGAATATAGKNSQPLNLAASSFSSTTSTPVNQTFQWKAEAAGNNTSTPSGTLNLLFGEGTSVPAETGLKVANNGQITFATGQTFPGTGTGTITGVIAGTDLTGGGSTGNITLNLDTTKVPLLTGGNSFTGNQTVNGNVSAGQLISTVTQGTAPLIVSSTTQVPNLNASLLDGLSASAFQVAGAYATLGANTFNATQTIGSGDVAVTSGDLDLPQTTSPTVGVINVGGNRFIHACCNVSDTFVGVAGNFTMSGNGNTAVGYSTMVSDTTGYSNAAFGLNALQSNTTGDLNTATGGGALQSNTTGSLNVASGLGALQNNTTGSSNVGVGYTAGNTTNNQNTTGSNNTYVGFFSNPGTQTTLGNVTAIGASAQVTASNATAIGANAQATASNSLVLGSISGVNGATASTNVGIGTTAPAATLDVHGTGNFTGFVSFAAGQTFPGTGTVVSVGSGAGLTGGPITGSGSLSIAAGGVSNAMLANSSLTINPGTGLLGSGAVSLGGSTTLNLDTTKVPLLTANNIFTGNQTVNGNLIATGVVTGSGFQIGANLFDYGSIATDNAFLGFAGNTKMTGGYNTGAGVSALVANSTGTFNTSVGSFSLENNTLGQANTAIGSEALLWNSGDSNGNGSYNAAVGFQALVENTTGNDDTAAGAGALYYNSTGGGNTANGYSAGNTLDLSFITGYYNTFLGNDSAMSTGSLNNASAIGAFAVVSASNAIVLGSINGVNGATASTSVGIGTTAPGSTLEVQTSHAQSLGPVVTITNNAIGSGTAAALDFNTITPAYGSGYNPTARIEALDQGNFSSNIVFEANVQGALNHGLQTNVLIDAVGDVTIRGNLIKGGGSFKIDHPLDPANKYLSHSFVESPDMMNVYNGNVRTDRRGLAVVTLPDYFEALNRDFRYQLTVIGQFAQAIVAREIANHRFTIRTNRPGVKVSWQVTGIRHDAFADAHRIPNEEEKPQQERGHYLHPELFGASPEQAIGIRPLPVSPEAEGDTARTSREAR